MKLTEKKDSRLIVRISENDLHMLKLAGVAIGQTPSDLVRMFVSSTVSALKLKAQRGEVNLEDLEALLND